jgi:hypothetical protein
LLAGLAAAWLCVGQATAGTLTMTRTQTTTATSFHLSAEGDLDWAHWGSFTVTDFDHPAGVTPQISNYTPLGTPSYGQYSDDVTQCNWLDGTVDQAETDLSSGIWASGPDTGYQLTVPASTTPRVLHLYIGSWNKTGTLELSLSDNSAASVTNVIPNTTTHRVTVTFAANSAGQTLTVNYHCNPDGLSYGNVTLIAATLSSAQALPLSVPQPQLSAGSPVHTGSTFYMLANPKGVATNGATAFAYQWQVSYNAGGYTDIAGGTSNPLPATVGSAGNYNYRVVVANSVLGGAAVTSAPVALTVTAPTSTLSASGEVLPAPAPPAFTPLDIDLTAEGVIDWGHWGYFNPTDYDYKNGTIGNFTQIGADAPVPFTSNVSFSWTDATSANNPVVATTSGVGLPVDNGFELNIPAATTNRLVQIYVGVNNAYLNVTASLSDSTSPLFTDNPTITLGTLRYSIAFSAATTGKTLKVRLTEIARTGGDGAISLLSAALQPVPPLSVSALVVDPGTNVLVGQLMVVSIPPLQPQGAAPFSYQWRRNTGNGPTNVPSATGRSLSFTAGSTIGTESCDVVITSSQGSITSAPVVLTRTAATGVLRLLALDLSPSGANLTKEGSLDWSHWGFAGPTDFDYKATGGALIGNFIPIGPASAVYSFGSGVSYIWTDGTPNLVATNNGGVYRFPAPNGFELDVAAAQTNRLLHVYVGSYQAVAHVEASLSDNSAVKLIDESLPYGGNGRYNIQFAAGSPGQTLVFRIYFYPQYPDGNVTLSAASLEGMPALVVGTPTVGPTNIVPAGSSITLQAQGANGVPPVKYQWQVDSGSGYAAMSGATNAQVTTSVGAALGARNYRVVVSDISGSTNSPSIALTVTAATSTLSGNRVSFDGQTIDLTAEGVIDWAQWGNGGVSGYEQKLPLAGQISQYSIIGLGPVNPYGGNGVHCIWSDGTPDPTGDTFEGLYINAAPNGFELTSEATAAERVFTVYCALYQATMHVEAMMSDNSAPIFVDESFTGTGAPTARYSFRYSSPSPGQHLIVRWWDAAGGNVTINAATLANGPGNLQVQHVSGGQLQVTWSAGMLLEAPAVNGPWTTNSAASPYTFTPAGTQKYFRAIIH